MLKEIKEFLDSIIYFFLNYFVCNIPIWTIRKALYKMLGLKIGKGSRILMKVIVVHPWKITIGDNTYINEHCFLDGRGGLIIGSNVTIAIYSKLITGYHNIDDESFTYLEKKIIIKDNCAVFADSIVLGGAFLNRGTVLSVGSVAKAGTYVKNGVYAGNPIKLIRKRKAEEFSVPQKWKIYFR